MKNECVITHKYCKYVGIVYDQYGCRYGTCKKCDTLLWNIEKCNDNNPVIKKRSYDKRREVK